MPLNKNKLWNIETRVITIKDIQVNQILALNNP